MKLQGRHILLLLLIACVAVQASLLYRHRRLGENCCAATLQGDTNHPAAASNWVDTRLYFGIGTSDAPDKRDADWQAFLDTEVTPRFPSGLSVLDVYGQWQRHLGTAPIRVRTKLLVIDYPATPDNESRIEALRVAWKKRTGDQSVMKVTQPADVSF